MEEVATNKKWYLSKTLWANVIALAVIFTNGAYEWVQITGEEQGALLIVMNLILRIATYTKLTFKK